MDQNPDLSLHRLSETDLQDIVDLLGKTFFSREPLFKSAEVSIESVSQGLSKMVLISVNHGVCFGLREKATGNLIAVKICEVLRREERFSNKVQDNLRNSETIKLTSALGKVPPPETLFDDPTIKKILFGRITNIDPSYSGRNLANILHDATDEAAAAEGCQVFYSHIANTSLLTKMLKRGCRILESSGDAGTENGSIVSGEQDIAKVWAVTKSLISESYPIKSVL